MSGFRQSVGPRQDRAFGMISLVIPCYNEEEVLELTYAALDRAAHDWSEPVEFLLIDDGSHDATWSLINGLSARDSRVRGVRLSRNFGHQAAVGAGLAHAAGDAVVVLDADLQDPPSVIGQLIARWREGYDVVYAQRNRREGESLLKRVTAHLFYRLLERVNSVEIPRDAGDFALLDRRVVAELVQLREHHLFWRGLRAWTGFKHVAVTFDRPGRARGTTKYTLRKLLALASNGLLAFSDLPLRVPGYLGSIGLMLGVAGGLVALIVGFVFPGSSEWLPAASVWVLWCVAMVQLISLGLVGEYLNRIYAEVRNRPRWIVDQSAGIAQSAVGIRRAG